MWRNSNSRGFVVLLFSGVCVCVCVCIYMCVFFQFCPFPLAITLSCSSATQQTNVAPEQGKIMAILDRNAASATGAQDGNVRGLAQCFF